MLNFIKNLFATYKLPDYIKNNGFQFSPPDITDWVLGKESGIVFDNRNPSGDWSKFVPEHEPQRIKFDSFSCVTFGGNNVLEFQLNWLLDNDKFSQPALDFFIDNGYIVNGKFNVNEIFNVAQNGTDKSGNYMQNYWNSVRKTGIVPQKAWTQLEDCNVWEDMQKPIPQAVKNLGLESLKYININYEWVLTSRKNDRLIKESLQQSPLQIATPICPTWKSGDVKSCGITQLAHVTTMYKMDDYYRIMDQYEPYFKNLALDYYIPCAIKAVITETGYTPPPVPKIPKHTFTKVMEYGTSSEDIRALQGVLKSLGYFKFDNITNYYGYYTAQAVYAFQVANQVASPEELNSLQGRRVGPKTLAKLNEIQK